MRTCNTSSGTRLYGLAFARGLEALFLGAGGLVVSASPDIDDFGTFSVPMQAIEKKGSKTRLGRKKKPNSSVQKLVVFITWPSKIIGNAFAKMIACTAFHPPDDASYSKHDVHFTTLADGKTQIAMWMSTPSGSNETMSKYYSLRPLILYSHGNAEDIGGVASYCSHLSDRTNCNVLTYDYVNYGQSSAGTPTQANLLEAAEAVYKFALNKMEARNVVLMGRSIGSAPAVYLAANHTQHMGLVLVSPLASGARTLSISRMFPRWLLTNLDSIFCPSVQTIQKVQCPVLILHGNQDDIIPVQNAYDLYNAIPTKYKQQPHFFGDALLPAGHNDLEEKFGDEIVGIITEFIRDQDQKATWEANYD